MSAPEPSLDPTGGATKPLPRKDDGPKVIPLIQGIRNGTISPRTIAPADRQLCLQEFLTEGMTTSEAAMILKCSERTLFRDLKALRKKHALGPDDLRAMELLGNLRHELAVCTSKARRAARDKNARPEDKIDAERLAAQVHLQQIALLARFGFLKAPSDPPLRICINLDGQEVPRNDSHDELEAPPRRPLGRFGIGNKARPRLPE